MGDNTINTQVDGTTIEASHVNQYKTALTVDVLPRNSGGVADDEAGSLGSSLYKWLKGIFSKVAASTIVLGEIDDEGTSPDIKNVSDNLEINTYNNDFDVDVGTGTSIIDATVHRFKVGGTTKSYIDINGLDGSYLKNSSVPNDSLVDNTITTAKLKTGGLAYSLTSGSASAISSTSYSDVTNLSVTVTAVTNRHVMLTLDSDGSANAARLYDSSGSGISYTIRIIRTNDSVVMGEWFIAGGDSITGFTAFDDAPISGNNTYKVQIKAASATGSILCRYIQLRAVQL